MQPSVWGASYLQPTPFLSRHRTVSRRTRGHDLLPLRPVVRGRTPPSRGIDTPHASHLQGTARLPGCFASAGLYLAAQTLRFRTTSHHTARHRNVSHRTARLEYIMYSLQPVVRGMAPPSRGIGAPYASHLQGTARLPRFCAFAPHRTTPHCSAPCRTAPHRLVCTIYSLTGQSCGAGLRLVEG